MKKASVGTLAFSSTDWWSWRESNPRPTTFRLPLYMLSLSLSFDADSPTDRDRQRLFPYFLADQLRTSRTSELMRVDD